MALSDFKLFLGALVALVDFLQEAFGLRQVGFVPIHLLCEFADLLVELFDLCLQFRYFYLVFGNHRLTGLQLLFKCLDLALKV